MKLRIITSLLLALCCTGCIDFDDPAVPFSFPADHGFHNNRFEWVYFSGMVETAEGLELGLMFTIFQIESNTLPWRMPVETGSDETLLGVRYKYPCILAVIDPLQPAYYPAISLGYSGSAAFEDGLPVVTAGASSYTLSPSGSVLIRSELDDRAIDLTLEPTMDVLPHGEDGIIDMGDGIDSAYYSLTNMIPEGMVSVDNRTFQVTGGRIWMDHQWGNWTYSGMFWDWFSLRFDDGGALMLSQLRDFDDTAIGGTWTYRNAGGEVDYGYDFTVEARRTYYADEARSRFPVDWHITIPGLDARFEVQPLFDRQNIHILWEGLCTARGTIEGQQFTAGAVVEMTGYEVTAPDR